MAKALIINDLVEKLGISISALEESIDCGHGTISKAIKNGKDLSTGIMEKIISAYPNVNKFWLLTGEGNMELGDEGSTTTDKNNNDSKRKSPGGKKRTAKTFTKEEVEEKIREQAQSESVTLYDEFALNVIGKTLWEAFLHGRLEQLGSNVQEKVKWCRLYAKEYYSQRIEEGNS